MHKLFSKILAGAYSFALICSMGIAQADQSFGYAKIGESYLQSFEGIKPASSAPSSSSSKVDFSKATPLSAREMCATTFSIFARVQNADNAAVYSPLETLVHDLNLFCFHSKDEKLRGNHLFSKVNQTRTVFGQAALAYKLANPTADITQLRKNQEFVKVLLSDEELFKALDSAIEQVAERQSDLLTFWQEVAKLEQEQIDKLFFKKDGYLKWLNLKALNKSSLAMEASTRMSNIYPLLWLTCDKVGLPVLKRLRTSVFGGEAAKESIFIDILNNLKSMPADYNPIAYYKSYQNKFTGPELANLDAAFEQSYDQTKAMFENLHVPFTDTLGEFKAKQLKMTKGFIITGLVTSGGWNLFKVYLAYGSLRSMLDMQHTTNHIHRKLIGAARVVQAVDAINAQLSAHKATSAALGTLRAAMEEKASANFKTLLGLLRTNTFKGNESVFSLSGRVKAAYTLIQEVKDELISFMKFVGEVDAYLSIAKLYKKYQHTPLAYSFVTFIEQDAPYIELQNFWNPMLDVTKAVGNNITFNVDGTGRAAIVTGSNSAGKSTIMVNGLSSTLLLAHTLGIAPVTSATMTPFDYLATSLKVQDNVATGESHFVAETRHAARLSDAIAQLPTGKKAFIAIDELFEGTTAAVGSKALHDFGQTLAAHDNLIFVISTQYQGEPTKLEQETNGVCKNHRVDVIKNDDGTITRPYKVEEGVSQVSIGNELLQQAFAGAR